MSLSDLPNDFRRSISDDHLYRTVLFIYIVFVHLRIAVSYRTVFVSSINRTGLYDTRPFVGSYFSTCVTGFAFVPGLLLASQLGFQYLCNHFHFFQQYCVLLRIFAPFFISLFFKCIRVWILMVISDVFTSVFMGSIPGVLQLLAYRQHVEILDFQHTPLVVVSVSS